MVSLCIWALNVVKKTASILHVVSSISELTWKSTTSFDLMRRFNVCFSPRPLSGVGSSLTDEMENTNLMENLTSTIRNYTTEPQQKTQVTAVLLLQILVLIPVIILGNTLILAAIKYQKSLHKITYSLKFNKKAQILSPVYSCNMVMSDGVFCFLFFQVYRALKYYQKILRNFCILEFLEGSEYLKMKCSLLSPPTVL